MAASDYVPIFFKNRLHLAGRPQMSSRPSEAPRSAVTSVELFYEKALHVPTCRHHPARLAASTRPGL
jgi:hypothetical protein